MRVCGDLKHNKSHTQTKVWLANNFINLSIIRCKDVITFPHSHVCLTGDKKQRHSQIIHNFKLSMESSNQVTYFYPGLGVKLIRVRTVPVCLHMERLPKRKAGISCWIPVFFCLFCRMNTVYKSAVFLQSSATFGGLSLELPGKHLRMRREFGFSN